MAFYCVSGDVKTLSDFLIAQSFLNQFDNLPLAPGHSRIAEFDSAISNSIPDNLGKERAH